MRVAIKKGFGFGLTSGVITTLGLMVGLQSATGSRLAVIGGIVAIAIADALSDALGMHVSEEAESVHTVREIWRATFATFIAKFAMAATFLGWIMLLPPTWAVRGSIIWGLLVLTVMSIYLANKKRLSVLSVIGEHVGIAIVVIIITYYLGGWVRGW